VTEAVSGASGSLKSALEDVKDWGRDTFAGLLKGTTTLGQALGGLRDKLIDTFANNAWDNLWGALFGGSGGVGEGGGLLSGVFNANGNVFRSGRVAAYAKGGVVTGPTTFPMRGGMGLMGEAGPEAILPLSRGPDGKLGVMARGGGGSQVIVQQTINISAGVAQTVRAEMLGLLPRFKEQALAGVIEANSRGGAARRGLA
jgi:phage-related minor tail protein